MNERLALGLLPLLPWPVSFAPCEQVFIQKAAVNLLSSVLDTPGAQCVLAARSGPAPLWAGTAMAG
jgi:hypothetical protein